MVSSRSNDGSSDIVMTVNSLRPTSSNCSERSVSFYFTACVGASMERALPQTPQSVFDGKQANVVHRYALVAPQSLGSACGVPDRFVAALFVPKACS